MTDDELLNQLGAAFSVRMGEPPPESVAALRAAVRVATRRKTRSLRRRRRISAALVAGTVSTGGWAAAAAAYGDTLPGPLRGIVYDVGLPVDSPNLMDARSHRDALRGALRRSDHDVIAAQAERLRRDLQNLNDHERSKIQRDAEQLLQQANDDHNSQNDHSDAKGDNGQTSGPSGTTVPGAPGPALNSNPTQEHDSDASGQSSPSDHDNTGGTDKTGTSETGNAGDATGDHNNE